MICLKTYDENIKMVKTIAEKVKECGGKTYYVGGFVRDKMSGTNNKDIDVEIHGVSCSVLEGILKSLGELITIGKNFGVYNLKGYGIDIAMPRSEKNRGKGHKNFEIYVEPFIGTYDASKRRDFTVNSIMQDVLTGEIVDHFGGKGDLKNGIIRHVNSKTFREDPLRVLRAAQFAARFNYKIADETLVLCKDMDLSELPKERVIIETEKAMLKADKPSIFFESLKTMDQLECWFPELKNLIGIEQNPKHHSEGDVWVHTMMVLDKAVKFREQVDMPFAFMLSAICHDFGKAVCTNIVNGEIHAYEHEVKGLPLAETFLKRLTDEKSVIKYVLNLTEFHMKPNTLAANNSSIKSTNKMFDAAIDPKALICIAIADGLGKTAPREYISYDKYLFERLKIYREYMSRPFVTGKDLIDVGVQPSEKFSEYLQFAHKLRLAGIDKASAMKQTMAIVKKDQKMIVNAEKRK